MAAVVLMVGLRLVALSSDPYVRLDWSAGLLTDEGFYIHNARNVALFGEARTDEFNNMLLSPLLHALQTAVFQVLGAGAVQARLISVACSLLTLAVFFAAMRRAFGPGPAWIATLFLGLDHTNLLYNRMALMDTPAALPAVGAFYCFVRGCEPGARKAGPWLAACGALLGVTVTGRMLAAYLLPVPFAALGVGSLGRRVVGSSGPDAPRPRGPVDSPILGRGRGAPVPERGARARGGVMPVAAGMGAVLGLYAVLWYVPHRAEIAPMNHYYRTRQVQPRSARHLLENVRHAFVGDHRGFSPYLFRHTPVVFALGVLGVGCWVIGSLDRRVAGNQSYQRPDDLTSRRPAVYMVAWLALGWLMLAVISYSPSRYYVTTYPALAGVAALTLWRLPEWLKSSGAASDRVRHLVAVAGGFFVFHALLAVFHYPGPLTTSYRDVAMSSAAVVAGIALWFAWPAIAGHVGARPRQVIGAAMALWAAGNGYWVADWLVRLNYSQARLSRWLAANLPADAVLIGDVAPGITMDSPHRAVHVQPGLVNDKQPVERFAGRPRYVAILDGRWKEPWWLRTYPELVEPARRVQFARVLRWDIGVYAVDDAPLPR